MTKATVWPSGETRGEKTAVEPPRSNSPCQSRGADSTVLPRNHHPAPAPAAKKAAGYGKTTKEIKDPLHEKASSDS